MASDSNLDKLDRLIGSWTTEATHPMVPGVVVHGTTDVSWVDGKKFVIIRARTDHPQFPNATSIIGDLGHDRVDDKTGKIAGDGRDAGWHMHYYDSRGVYRDYETEIDDTAWRWHDDVPGFSQRFVGTFSKDGNTIDGQSQLRRDDVNWVDDLKITYRRASRDGR